jgi:hypothetical protein
MDIKEKILLIDCLLRDIRGDWSSRLKLRARLAESLCKEIYKKYNEESSDDAHRALTTQFFTLGNRCHDFIDCHYDDGRYFREEFPYGYEGLDKFHGFTNSFKERSDEFKWYAYRFLNNPNQRFVDFVDKEETAVELWSKRIVVDTIKQKIIDMVRMTGVKDIMDDREFPSLYCVDKFRDWLSYRGEILRGYVKFTHESETIPVQYEASLGDREDHCIFVGCQFKLGSCNIVMSDSITDPEILKLLEIKDDKFDELVKMLEGDK